MPITCFDSSRAGPQYSPADIDDAALFARYDCEDSVRLDIDSAVQSLRAVELSEFYTRKPDMREYLIDAARDGVDFACQYAVVTTGCGTACQTGLLIDLSATAAGRMYALPTSEWGSLYRADSRLWIINPRDEVALADRPAYALPVYMLWHPNKFTILYDFRSNVRKQR